MGKSVLYELLKSELCNTNKTLLSDKLANSKYSCNDMNVRSDRVLVSYLWPTWSVNITDWSLGEI